jgi:hypothetical protein
MALGTQSAQEKCDSARITAWKTYLSCVDTVVVKDVEGASFDEEAAFTNCRHTYFKNWTAFQPKASLAGSTCIGSRFTVTDSGATVTDGLTRLVWELKTGTVGGGTDFSNPENVNNTYSWSMGSPYAENGTAFTTFLTAGLNAPGFAGANGWRLPTLAELQTIVLDFPCTGAGEGPTCSCGTSPCIDGTFGPTQSGNYWSATSYVPFPDGAWGVGFGTGFVDSFTKSLGLYVRAVRGGL